jgi:hypothetical protein
MASNANDRHPNLPAPKCNTLEEKIALFKLWKRSGISRSEFIRRHNLSKTFHYWCNKLRPKILTTDNLSTSAATLESFVPVVADTSANHVATSVINPEKVELSLSADAMQIKLNLTIEQAISLIRGLNHANTIIQ